MSRQKWTSLGPMLIASMGKPAFEWLGRITTKDGAPCGADYIADLDMLDFTLVATEFYDLHEEAMRNLATLFERAKTEEDSKDDSNSGLTPSSAEGTDLTKSGSSTSVRSAPLLQSPPQGRPVNRTPSLGSSTPPTRASCNATSGSPQAAEASTQGEAAPPAEEEESTSAS